MNQIFKNTPFGNFAFFALLFVVFLLGANARESGANMRVEYNTVASYYFDKSSRLFADGELPAVDKWDFAPLQHEENAPPLLAYLTVWSYKVFSIFSGNSFEEFVYGFPVLIYGLWLLALAFIFSDLFNRWIAFAGALLFSFMSVSIELTRRGLYFEETVGNLFLFLSIYFIYKIFSEPRTARSWSAGAILAITALALSWQQFPVFYGVAVIAFLLIPDRSDQKRLFVRWSLVLVVPLFLGHAIARYLVGTDYSPFAMIRELMLGFQMYGDPDLTLAMRRGDWADLTWRGFYRYFGWLGLVLIAAGFLSILSDFKNYKKRFF
ncbi:MAG: glycosyltransferase family 39 protein, partial [Candidatus Sungbacteria bacterium]|nr:glycosyltransferase family 39 protein [Candidatus Sungbacteria bacterium]